MALFAASNGKFTMAVSFSLEPEFVTRNMALFTMERTKKQTKYIVPGKHYG
jgi:hypothetical protein